MKSQKLENLYSEPLPISESKYKDLNKLCDRNLIPKESHPFYRSLPYVSKHDRLPNPDLEETSCGSDQSSSDS
jgi:hypothetical protein